MRQSSLWLASAPVLQADESAGVSAPVPSEVGSAPVTSTPIRASTTTTTTVPNPPPTARPRPPTPRRSWTWPASSRALGRKRMGRFLPAPAVRASCAGPSPDPPIEGGRELGRGPAMLVNSPLARGVAFPGVFPPLPDTWLWARAACGDRVAPGGRILELCAGPAFAGIAAARRHGAHLTTVDVSRRSALNARLNALVNRVPIDARV